MTTSRPSPARIAIFATGHTVADVARAAGYTREHLSGMLNGKYPMSARARRAVAEATRRPQRELFGDDAA